MPEFIPKIKNLIPNHEKAIHWIKLISITGGSQTIIQVLGLLSGIIVIRLLSINEYALYTIANTMLGTMSLLADGGISTGVLSQGGKVWHDRQKLGAVIVTGLYLRKKFAIGSLILAVPILIYLLKHNGASWLNCILISLTLIPAFFAALSDSLYEVAPKLLQDIVALQKNQLVANISRFLLLAGSLFLLPWTFIALLGNGISRLWANFRLKKIISNYADLNEKPNPLVKNEILRMVKRILPGAVYYSFSGQITIWLISIVGSTAAIAKVGALSRLAIMLNLISVMFSIIIVPRFAKLPNNRTNLIKRYIQIQLGFLLLSIVITFLIWLFPSQVLWILGKHYANLQKEIVVNIIGSCISLIAGSSFVLYSSRGWAINPIISIVIEILAIIVGVLFINISTIKGILTYNIFIASVQVLIHGSFCIFKILNIKMQNEVS